MSNPFLLPGNCADTYGSPGPEGKAFFTVLGVVALAIFLAVVLSPFFTGVRA